jgi:hypothetical protein
MKGSALPLQQLTFDEVRDQHHDTIEVLSALRLCASAVGFLFSNWG